MRILIVDPETASRDVLYGRVEEALRQIGLRRVEILAGDISALSVDYGAEPVSGIFLGPGCYSSVEQTVQLCKGSLPNVPVGLVLDNEVYAADAVELRRMLTARLMALADIAQMAGFILDCETQATAIPGQRNRGIISLAQFKGGVGTSTLAAGFAACWARHGLSVALVDFDDVNPQLTDWGRVGASQRRTVSELLRSGEVPKHRINECVNPVEGFDGRLVVVPQPERYQESFHFKADVLEGAPSSAIFVQSLLTGLRDEFDVIVVDLGRSWGISTFATLPQSQQVLLVTDDDGMSVRRTLDTLKRMESESDDSDEFDLTRWNLVLNAYSGKLLSPKDLSIEIQELDLFPESSMLYTIPFSERGRQWGAPGQSFYDLAEPHIRDGFKKIAFNLIPFKMEVEPPMHEKLLKQLQRIVSP